jgi:hypothetical protein
MIVAQQTARTGGDPVEFENALQANRNFWSYIRLEYKDVFGPHALHDCQMG